jgi:hypothetical protein
MSMSSGDATFSKTTFGFLPRLLVTTMGMLRRLLRVTSLVRFLPPLSAVCMFYCI